MNSATLNSAQFSTPETETVREGSSSPASPEATMPASPLWDFLRQSWLVLLLATALGGALAGVERWLQPRIQRQAERRLLDATREVVPGGVRSEKVPLESGIAYRVVDERGELTGWAIPATVTGFVDQIELLIGLSVDASRILGLAILQSKETPGLGDRIREAEFRAQFQGLAADQPLEVVKPGQSSPQGIDAIAGATISTWAVVRGVHEQVERVRSELGNQSSDP